MQPADEAIPVALLTATQRDEVTLQLEQLLASSLFRQSKRYPAFLRYVVETTLEGNDEGLKERTIGMEVFGRLPNYDTSMDPTVRLTAAEVRKRLAQYYQQPERGRKVHIELHPGSYVPVFTWPVVAPQPTEELHAALVPMEVVHTDLPAVDTQVTAVGPAAKSSFRFGASFIAAAAMLLIAVGYLGYRHTIAAASPRDLWVPLLTSTNPISIVLPDLSKTDLLPQAQETESTTVLAHIRNNRLVDFNDSVALARLSAMLGKWDKPYRVLLSSDTTYEDLQSGPSILIGAVDNPWTMRFLQPLPYSVARKGDTMTFGIVAKDPGLQQAWSIDLSGSFEKLQQDFGIVARQVDTMTGRPVLIVAGLGQNGTAAGIRLLADPALAREITEAAPKDWSGRNLEIVFRTQIIDDKFGPPVVVARKYW